MVPLYLGANLGDLGAKSEIKFQRFSRHTNDLSSSPISIISQLCQETKKTLKVAAIFLLTWTDIHTNTESKTDNKDLPAEWRSPIL